jgi:hypothetical protein
MEDARVSWTDERLDDLAARMNDGFNRVDADIRSLHAEMNARFDALQRTIVQVGGGVIATMVVGFVGLAASHL